MIADFDLGDVHRVLGKMWKVCTCKEEHHSDGLWLHVEYAPVDSLVPEALADWENPVRFPPVSVGLRITVPSLGDTCFVVDKICRVKTKSEADSDIRYSLVVELWDILSVDRHESQRRGIRDQLALIPKLSKSLDE